MVNTSATRSTARSTARSSVRSGRPSDEDVVPRAVVPADVDAADVIAWGLSFRQLAIIVAGVAALWSAHDRFGPLMPPPVWGAAAILVLAASATLALGRRDGLPERPGHHLDRHVHPDR